MVGRRGYQSPGLEGLSEGGCRAHRDARHAIGRARRAGSDETEVVAAHVAVVVAAAAAGHAEPLAVVGGALVVLPSPVTLSVHWCKLCSH